MRLEENGTVVLSEKNLLSLLSKLYTTGSACTIVGGQDCPGLFVRAETDDEHYGEREYSAGRMHPTPPGGASRRASTITRRRDRDAAKRLIEMIDNGDPTERIVAAVREAARGATI